MKRLLFATLLGVVFGFVCFGFAASGNNDVSWQLAVSIVLGRTLIGFGIGISRLKIYWALHGLLMGLVFSLPFGFSAMLGPENPEFSHHMMLISSVVMGMIYGFLIELLTSVVFKARLKS